MNETQRFDLSNGPSDSFSLLYVLDIYWVEVTRRICDIFVIFSCGLLFLGLRKVSYSIDLLDSFVSRLL